MQPPATDAPSKLEGRVLVLEDDPMVAHAWVDVLERAGCVTARTDRIDVAWRMLNGRAFDLLVSDYHLTDGHATTLLTQLQEARSTCPVILITAAGWNPEDAVRHGQHVAAVLRKPVTPESLLAAVTACLAGGSRKVIRKPGRSMICRAERSLLLDEPAVEPSPDAPASTDEARP